ncbi:MAG: FtsQ-type POTRA domain-containing protein [Verrucomicrobiota bacterium]
MIRGGKGKGSSSASGSQSWRELAGPRRKRVNSPQAKKRRQARIFKLLGAFLALLLLISLGIWTSTLLKERERPIQISTPSKEISQIMFETDGVLPNKWLGTVLKLDKGTTMMEVDIHAMKQSLEGQAQVVRASVERVFPSALKITIEEHIPVLRIAVPGSNGKVEQRVVARDGSIYQGIGYSKADLDRLPFVQPYLHSDGSVRPMRGIERVDDLLSAGRQEQPEFYKTWKVISLQHYSGYADMPGEVIEVRSSYVPRVIFGASTDFSQQLDRLKVILDYVRARGNPSLKRIDLSLRGSAAVQFTSGRVSTF